MTRNEILLAISHHRVVPVIAIDSLEAALPLADALLEGGLPVMEITFRTAAAKDVVQKISEERPEMLVGAGTVLTSDDSKTAQRLGARFAVSPGLNPEVVASAQAVDLLFVPGVATPSEVERGLAIGCKVLKFFPAAALGGVDMLRALSAPYRHRDVRFLPTGGVNETNMLDYLQLEEVVAVGGTWIATPEDLAKGRWNSIRDRCKHVVNVVGGCEKTMRSKGK